MALKCCLCGARVNVFKFPLRDKLKHQWLAACGIIEAPHGMGVCIAHFPPEAVKTPLPTQKRTVLTFNAVPRLLLLQRPPAQPSPKPGPSTLGAAAGLLATSERIAQQSPPISTWTPEASTCSVEPAGIVAAWTRPAVRTPGTPSSLTTPGRDRDLDCLMEDEELDGELELEACLGVPYAPLASSVPEDLADQENEGASSVPEDLADRGHWSTRSAVVSEPQLLSLAKEVPIHCCSKRCLPAIKRVSISFVITWTCTSCQRTAKQWTSTEKIGEAAIMDTVWAASVVLSGCHEAKVNRLLEFANMGKLSRTAFHHITTKAVQPVVADAFNATLAANREAAKAVSPGGLIVTGDCQNDSPGFSAAYGTYTAMDHTTGHILAQNTVCRQETGLSSPKLETEGVSRCLEDLQHVSIKEFVSDQHLGVKKVVKRRLPKASHSYDVWHAAKNVARRLREKAAKAENRALVPWVRHVKNHFWWCAQTCQGDAQIFQKRWSMVANHVVNIHATGLNWCHHDHLPEGEPREAPWLEPGSPAHQALLDVVTSGRTLDLAPHIVNSRHTGNLEVFHAANQVYTPKPMFCMPALYTTRKRLAVLDYSAHISRDYARNTDGTIKTQRVYSRLSDAYVSRPVKVAKKYSFVRPLLEAAVERRLRTIVTGETERAENDPRMVYPHVHRGPRPNESQVKLE